MHGLSQLADHRSCATVPVRYLTLENAADRRRWRSRTTTIVVRVALEDATRGLEQNMCV